MATRSCFSRLFVASAPQGKAHSRRSVPTTATEPRPTLKVCTPFNQYLQSVSKLIPCLPLLADAELLVISMTNVSDGGQSHLRVRISCQSMDLAAELVQDMAK